MTLFAHQDSGAAWLAERAKAYLGDEPGLGKTRTLIAAARRAGVQRPLIITPAIVRSHWLREIVEEGDFAYAHIHSYDEVVRGGLPMMAAHILKEKVDALIVDEAHYTKHPTSQRARIIFGADGYARRLPIVWPASGTPMPRNPLELYTVLSRIAPELLLKHGFRTYRDFGEHFTETRRVRARGEWRDKVVGAKNVEELKAILARVMLRRTLADVGLDVPAIWWQEMRVDGAGTESDLMAVVSDPPAVTRAVVSALQNAEDHLLSSTLADIANDPHVARMRRRLGELKAPLVGEQLHAQLLNGNEKVAVFAYHRSVLDILHNRLGDLGVARVDGDTSPRARDDAIDDFAYQADRGPRVFLGQNIAVQTGMDGLQGVAHRAILVEPEWTPDVNLQLAKRLARIGSTADRVIAQMVVLAGTLDEAIVAQNLRETRMVQSVLG